MSLGALRAKKKALDSPAGTVRRPITIHVATERTSWGHEAEAEAQMDISVPGGVRVRIPSPTPSSEESHAQYDNAIEVPRIVYPPRPHHRQRSATTASRTSAASTSTSQVLEVKTLGVPPPLTPIESDVEQQYRARERKYEGLDFNLDLDTRDIDFDAESSEEGGPHSFGQFAMAGKRRSLSGPVQKGPLVDARGSAKSMQTVTHVALPPIRAHLGSRFSTGRRPRAMGGERRCSGAWKVRAVGVCSERSS